MNDSYFLRIAKKDEEKAKALFSDAECCYLPEEDKEFAMVIPSMENGKLEAMLENIDVIKKIRIAGEDE